MLFYHYHVLHVSKIASSNISCLEAHVGFFRMGPGNFFKNYIFEISAFQQKRWGMSKLRGRNFHWISSQRKCGFPFLEKDVPAGGRRNFNHTKETEPVMKQRCEQIDLAQKIENITGAFDQTHQETGGKMTLWCIPIWIFSENILLENMKLRNAYLQNMIVFSWNF